MNEVLKQRLVGALILVALGVVFWPIIFVEPGERGGADEARIPPRPQVDTTPVETPGMAGLRPSPEHRREEPAPDRPLLTLAPESPSPTSVDRDSQASGQAASEPVVKTPTPPPEPATKPPASDKKTRSEPPVKPEVDDQGIPVVWILRVASVSNAARADELRKRLLDMGHKAYTKKVRSGDKTLYRVYVGPKAEKAKLEKLQPAIDAEFGVSSLITRYYP